MTNRQLEDRLRQWYLAEAESSPMPPTLSGVFGELGDARPTPPRMWERRRLVVLLAALLLLAAAISAAVGGSRLVHPDRVFTLDPATLNPCRVLPGQGWPPAAEPRLHEGAPAVGGDACAYGYDSGDNLHFQLRDEWTASDESGSVASALFEAGGGDAISLRLDGNAAWLGRTPWSTRDTTPCAAMAVSDSGYFFVVWLTCRDDLPLLSDPRWSVFREDLEQVSRKVIANLEAMNEGRPPV